MSDNGKALADKPAADAFGRVFVLKDVGTLKQRDAVAWNRAYLTHGARAAMADERQAALQAAIVAGWIVEPATRWEDVTDSEGKSERRHYLGAVSYTHLDVYKRQGQEGANRADAGYRRKARRAGNGGVGCNG